jgi:uncharacterized protein
MAAEQGFASAHYNLGLMYANGQGVAQDYAEAVKWYRKAAEQGFAVAQSKLGLMYYNGQGVEQDYAKAVKWFRKAAEQGNAEARLLLGAAYADGQGVAQDYVQALMWFDLATTSFAASQDRTLDQAVSIRDQVAGKMTPAQIAEAQKLAAEWTPKKN